MVKCSDFICNKKKNPEQKQAENDVNGPDNSYVKEVHRKYWKKSSSPSWMSAVLPA